MAGKPYASPGKPMWGGAQTDIPPSIGQHKFWSAYYLRSFAKLNNIEMQTWMGESKFVAP